MALCEETKYLEDEEEENTKMGTLAKVFEMASLPAVASRHVCLQLARVDWSDSGWQTK